ncbi:hypothetical protein M1L60_33340 [Actinoplanes sp. TRM 88003]|uniref:Uncharacterized protein n=1 Tax=Paractinoplanes aksuensis TaxID=2939490 RepID=A0ABT1DXA5_9ACTN|nr:hypothetical protein [Actinoplanes aksuensis]MCO8275479.1 hypothetical protein [Actinoplanes aksuensis]
MPVRFEMLGPVEVCRDGAAVDLGARQPRLMPAGAVHRQTRLRMSRVAELDRAAVRL